MLKLRTILLSNYLYILILILTIIISIPRIIIPRTSNYTTMDESLTGTITKYAINGNRLSMTLKGKEQIICNYYFKTKKEMLSFRKNIKLGDKLYIKGEFKTPSVNTTKNLFNYQKYLKHKRIFYTISITSYKKISSTNNIYYLIKQKILDNLQLNPYLYTFIIGDKSYLATDAITSYQENGISHLFAISGMHISLLSSIILNIFKRLKLSETKSYFITSIILLFYLLLVGLSPSIIRGVLFFILFSLNKIYYLYISKINIFILTLSITLLINPFFVFDLGFIYSFLISLSLLITSKWLISTSYLLGLLKVSFISFLVSVPISLYNFYQINILSIIYNIFYVPLVSVIIFPLSIITSIIPFLLPIYTFMTNILEATSIYLSHISIGKLIFSKVNIIIYILEFIITFLLIVKIKTKKIYLVISFFIILSIHYYYPSFQKQSYMTMIDVGQGDSTLMHSNNESVLIDTGGIKSYQSKSWQQSTKKNSIIKNTTIPVLKSRGIKKLKYLILTHGDFDHMGEAINLVNNFKVEKVIFNCGPYNDLEQELIEVLDKKQIKYYSCIKELNIDNNKLYFLQTKEYDNENDNSNVIYTELNGYKFIFMGDAGVTTEKEILNKYNLQDIDVLKVGHHGSRTSSGKEFIDEINPKYSIISVGKNNRYGHPNKEVLNTLENSKIYRTDQDGSIMFKIKNNKLKIETCSP